MPTGMLFLKGERGKAAAAAHQSNYVAQCQTKRSIVISLDLSVHFFLLISGKASPAYWLNKYLEDPTKLTKPSSESELVRKTRAQLNLLVVEFSKDEAN